MDINKPKQVTPSQFTRPVLKSSKAYAPTPRGISKPRTGSNPRAVSVSTPRSGNSPDLPRYPLHIESVLVSKKTQSDMPQEKTPEPKAGERSASIPRGPALRPASTSKPTPEGAGAATLLGRPSTPAKEQKTLSTQAFFAYLSNHAKLPPSSDKISDALQVTIAEYISFSAFSASSHTFANPMNEKIALAIAKNLGMFTNPKAQESIAKSIFEGKLGEPMREDVALAIAKNLGTFTNDDAQKSIAESINTGKFGNSGETGDIMSEDVAIAIAKNLGTFTNDDAKKSIANSINTEKFGYPMPTEVALAIAKNLGTFTDEAAQQSIADSINTGKFGNSGEFEDIMSEAVALAIAKNLNIFTDKDARENISEAIANGLFGGQIPNSVTSAIVENLGMFTNPEAQINISRAISEGRFSDGHFKDPLRPIIAVAIAKNLPRFTDAEAQQTLSAAMAKGVFGNPIPQAVNKALLSILGGSGLGA
jgi:hypothetical protein